LVKVAGLATALLLPPPLSPLPPPQAESPSTATKAAIRGNFNFMVGPRREKGAKKVC
jgi:hypothetical protein